MKCLIYVCVMLSNGNGNIVFVILSWVVYVIRMLIMLIVYIECFILYFV